MSDSDSVPDFLFDNITSGTESEYFDSSDDDFLSDNSDASSVGNNPPAWNMIGDPFGDIRPDNVPEFLGIPGPNPDVFPDEDVSFTRSVDALLPVDLFHFIVQCTNSKAQLYFANHPQVNFKIHGLQ
uniref:Uncharacterized protein LOC114348567 n=1 Tax=Diabrotica virgifera virgifera TaxID=50390 RepID=A0A6P7GZY0_DIAVI